ncbi:hypothetical protein N7526_008136 [Penicillium atrosanguineum]|nr:hypothetical protein N7526_008136 [Penicillium atrosanguineum]
MARKSAPPPPPPPPPPSSMRASTKKSAKPAAASHPTGSFEIRVEVEFLLSPRSTNSVETIRWLLHLTTTNLQESLLDIILRCTMQSMKHILGRNLLSGLLTLTQRSRCQIVGAHRGGLESISPIFRVHENSTWRQHIEFLWNFLRTDFQVNANTSCGTHVHLSRAGGYSIADLKKICQSIIHFEPAFEALLPEDRLSNEYARSNWLDNTNFGHQNLSRK